MSFIRNFKEEDVPAVAALFHKVYLANDPAQARTSVQKICESFEEIFLRNPWRGESLPSLVCEDKDGATLGFIGVTPRRMTIRGRPILAAVSAHLMLDPDRRLGLAGVQLLRQFLAGPQQLSIADFANDLGRAVWDGIGGKMSYLHSLQWVKPLRPSARALNMARRKLRIPAALSPILRPLSGASDAMLARISPHRFRFAPPELIAKDLDDETLLACLSLLPSNYSLIPEYDGLSLGWLMRRAERMKTRGQMRKTALCDDSGAIVGWYLYYLNPGGTSEVLQMWARKGSAGAVLDHLFHNAWSQGSDVIAGRAEQQLLPALSSKECYLNCGPPWVMVHARNPEILQAIDRGDAFLSKLEGEWCTSYRA
jgi:hypothetical protein